MAGQALIQDLSFRVFQISFSSPITSRLISSFFLSTLFPFYVCSSYVFCRLWGYARTESANVEYTLLYNVHLFIGFFSKRRGKYDELFLRYFSIKRRLDPIAPS